MLHKMKNSTFSLILFSLCLSHTSYANTQNLNEVQQQLRQQQRTLVQQKKDYEALQKELKKQEQRISDSINQLRETNQALNAVNQELSDIQQAIQQQQQQLKTQHQQLEQQIDSLYRRGINTSILEKLLSKEAQENDRMLMYYRKFNQARTTLIKEIEDNQQTLQYQQQQARLKEYQLNELKTQQQNTQSSLQKSQQQRESTRQKLARTMNQTEARISALKKNEQQLRQAITQAETVQQEKRKQQPQTPTQPSKAGQGLGRAQKQYTMPTQGSIANRFNSIQMGELRWRGIVINSRLGASVNAISDGEVILANWLNGYGLIVVIDHGQGDMSLYGYNQSLGVREGQKVKRGQKIAEVGNSGGQQQASLYFEIRRRGQAVNPLDWVQ